MRSTPALVIDPRRYGMCLWLLGCSTASLTDSDRKVPTPVEDAETIDAGADPDPVDDSGEEEDTSSVDDTGSADDTGSEEDTGTGEELDPPRECDWGIYDEAVAYADAYPLRDGASWSGWCASLMWRFASMPESSARASAILAYADSTIEGTDPRLAPAGAFHWWDIGTYGHVGMDLLGGGGTVFMASTHVLEDWGDSIGVASVPAYTTTASASYLGWSLDYAGSEMDGGGLPACDEDLHYEGVGTVPVTNTQDTGVPNATFYMRLQLWAAQHGYTGPIDGELGPNTWRGVQMGLVARGYAISVTGTPDEQTYAAIQSVAALYGYTGPIDGEPGPNTYRGFARFLNDVL